MRTKLIEEVGHESEGYGAGSGDIVFLTFECPCGKGKIVEEHDEIPGFRDSGVWLDCPECRERYTIDTSQGVWNWELVEK